jgi:predicted DNA-binding protein with PD1-like motif
MWQGAGQRTFVVVLDPGEDPVKVIGEFAAAEKVTAASLTALGAFERATLGWFALNEKRYRPIEVQQQCEALSVLGDIALDERDRPSVHIHAVVGLVDGTTRGGHLLKAAVQPTLEVTLVEVPAHLRRRKRPELGIALIDLV